MNAKRIGIALAAGLGLCGSAAAEDGPLEITLHELSAETGVGDAIGTVQVERSDFGLLLTPDLSGLSPGLHGFHVHEHPSCEPGDADGEWKAGQAAGGHYDPADTGKHRGPYSEEGHLGDLPALYVDEEGMATHPVLAPRLGIRDIQDRALMVHAGGDNYADEPEPLGGGGDRVACGVVTR